MALSDNIRTLRIANGMTMQQLAARCDCCFQQIAKFENDTRKPNPYTLVMLARALGVSCEELVLGNAAAATVPAGKEVE